MTKKTLVKITQLLKNALVELERAGLQDHAIRHRYAEFFVACELVKRGHDIQLLGDRDDKSADIYLADKKKRVEIKSGKCDQDNWACASFGKGNQISADKFDYCVFVTFNPDNECVRDVLVFEKKDLQEIKKRRKSVARHESTNPCLFVYAPSQKKLDDWIKDERVKIFKIEREVHKYPNKFKCAWNKIK